MRNRLTIARICFGLIVFCFFAPIGFKLLIVFAYELDMFRYYLSEANPKGVIVVAIIACTIFALRSAIFLAAYCMGISKLENKPVHYVGLFCALLVVSYLMFVSARITFIFEGLPIIGCILLIACTEFVQRKNSN